MNIGHHPDNFLPKTLVYDHKRNHYAVIKKFDETKKVYQCKPRFGSEGTEDASKAEDYEANQEDLSEHIVINARIITEDT